MPIGISVRMKFDMRSFAKIPEAQKLALTKSRDDGLELIRKTLRDEAPSSRKGNKYSKNRVVDFLRAPSRCVRRIGRYSGYVFLNQKILPHIKYIIHGTKKHSIKGNPLLSFWWLHAKTWFIGREVKHPGFKSNDFIARAWLRVRGTIYKAAEKHFLKAIRTR